MIPAYSVMFSLEQASGCQNRGLNGMEGGGIAVGEVRKLGALIGPTPKTGSGWGSSETTSFDWSIAIAKARASVMNRLESIEPL